MSTKVPATNVRLKRVHEPPDSDDCPRILVDRLWPRAVTKEAAAIDAWMKEVAPSTELRRWFGHDTDRWDEFCRLYAAEVHQQHQSLLVELRHRARKGRITLVFSARDEEHNNAVALRHLILQRRSGLHGPLSKKRDVNLQGYPFVTASCWEHPLNSSEGADELLSSTRPSTAPAKRRQECSPPRMS
jgi:uncharacterized protein YeaO (DUF488 family)